MSWLFLTFSSVVGKTGRCWGSWLKYHTVTYEEHTETYGYIRIPTSNIQTTYGQHTGTYEYISYHPYVSICILRLLGFICMLLVCSGMLPLCICMYPYDTRICPYVTRRHSYVPIYDPCVTRTLPVCQYPCGVLFKYLDEWSWTGVLGYSWLYEPVTPYLKLKKNGFVIIYISIYNYTVMI